MRAECMFRREDIVGDFIQFDVSTCATVPFGQWEGGSADKEYGICTPQFRFGISPQFAQRQNLTSSDTSSTLFAFRDPFPPTLSLLIPVNSTMG
ncbi:uncharacterized protein PV09_08822 [Verruconis gallopava]|uniref:Uncharacterized protein n=1 Tax=Verruconis gallopava TaxID=253628 RepID=A0A0D1YFL6_9PEZI|nr:uncharacterized protein PV09_08822 [Verruconis gallopava]KIV99516.1 hypothetical protein PV09_08822 [Verruconis gallopava]